MLDYTHRFDSLSRVIVWNADNDELFIGGRRLMASGLLLIIESDIDLVGFSPCGLSLRPKTLIMSVTDFSPSSSLVRYVICDHL